MTAPVYPARWRMVALAVLVVAMALLVACSQPPGSPVEHRVHEIGVASDITPSPPPPTPDPPPVDSVRFTLHWYTGSVRALTSDADLQQLLEAWREGRPVGGDDPPVVRAGESAVVLRAGNDFHHPVDVRDVRAVDGDIVVMLDIEEQDREGQAEERCAGRWASGTSNDVFVIVVAVEDLPLERVRLDGTIVDCEPPADEEDEIFRDV